MQSNEEFLASLNQGQQPVDSMAAANALRDILAASGGNVGGQQAVTNQPTLTVDDAYKIAAARDAGVDPRTLTPIQREFAGGDQQALVAKYGLDAVAKSAQVYSQGAAIYENDKSSSTGFLRGGADLAVDATKAFVGGGTGLVALGAGLLNDAGGQEAAGWHNNIQEGLTGLQSDIAIGQKRAYDARTAATELQSKAVEDAQIAAGEDPTGAQRFVTDMGQAIKQADGSNIGSLIAGGVGSFASGGTLSKGLRALSSRAIPFVANKVGANSTLVAGLEKLGSVIVSQPVTSALTEAGSAFAGTVSAGDKISTETMMANSQEFRDQVASGVSPEDAKLDLVNKAGLASAAGQGLVSAATGVATKGFEKGMFKGGNLTTNIGKVLGETVEEPTQGASEQLLQNITLQDLSGNKDTLEGVGTAAGQGALAGFGLSAATQAPSIIKNAITAPVNIVRGVYDYTHSPSISDTAAESRSFVHQTTDYTQPRVSPQATTADAGVVPTTPINVASVVRGDIPEVQQVFTTASDPLKKAMKVKEGSPVPTTLNTIQKLVNVINGSNKDTADRAVIKEAVTHLTSILDTVNDFDSSKDTDAHKEVYKQFKDSNAMKGATFALNKFISTETKLAKEAKAVKAAAKGKANPTASPIEQKTRAASKAARSFVQKQEEETENVVDGKATVEDSPETKAAIEESKGEYRPIFIDATGQLKAAHTNKTDLDYKAIYASLQESGDRRVYGDMPEFKEFLKALNTLASNSKDPLIYAHKVSLDLDNADEASVNKALKDIHGTEDYPGLKAQLHLIKGAILNQANSGEKTSAEQLAVFKDVVSNSKSRDGTPGKSVRKHVQGIVEAIASDKKTRASTAKGKIAGLMSFYNKHNAKVVRLNKAAVTWHTSDKKATVYTDGEDKNEFYDGRSDTHVRQVHREASILNGVLESLKEYNPEQFKGIAIKGITPLAAVIGKTTTRKSDATRESKREADTNKAGEPRAVDLRDSEDTVLDGLEDLFKAPKYSEDYLANTLANLPSKALTSQVTSLVNTLRNSLTDAVEATLNKRDPIKDKYNESFAELRLMSLVYKDGEEYKFHGGILDRALLAAVSYLATANSRTGGLTYKNVHETLGLARDVEVSPDILHKLNQGVLARIAISELAKVIKDNLGLEHTKDAPMAAVDSIYTALASQILTSFTTSEVTAGGDFDGQGTGFMYAAISKVGGLKNRGGTDVTPVIFTFAKVKPKSTFETYHAELKEVLTPNSNKLPEFNKEPAPTTIGKNVSKADIAIEAADKVSDIPFRLNHRFLSLLERFNTVDNYTQLFSGWTAGAMNERHASTVEAVSTDIRKGVEFLLTLAKDAPKGGWVKFPSYVSDVLRLQLSGSITPQSNKTVRAGLTPHETTVTDTNRAMYLRAVLQGLDIDVETLTDAEVKEQLEDKAREYAAVIKVLKGNGKFTEADLKTLHEAKLGKVRTLQALSDYAAYLTKSEGHTTHLAIEIDGVANGIANILMLFGTEPLTDERKDNLQRVGITIGTDNPKVTDGLYDHIGSLATVAVEAIHGVISPVMGGIEFSDGVDVKVTFTKSLVKQIVIPAQYSGGVATITNTLTKEFLDKFYAWVSSKPDWAETDNEYFLTNLNTTLNTSYSGIQLTKPDFEFTPDKVGLLKAAIETHIVKPIHDRTITEMGDAYVNLLAINSLVGVTAALKKARLTELITAAHGTGENKTNLRAGLSLEAWKGIFTELAKEYPPIELGVASMNAVPTKIRPTEEAQSKSLDNKLAAYVQQPTVIDLASSLVARLNLAAGDATTMAIFINGLDDSTKNSLLVAFDGVSVGVDHAVAAQLGMNQGAIEAWKVNPNERVLAAIGSLDTLNKKITDLTKKDKKLRKEIDVLAPSGVDTLYTAVRENISKVSETHTAAATTKVNQYQGASTSETTEVKPKVDTKVKRSPTTPKPSKPKSGNVSTYTGKVFDQATKGLDTEQKELAREALDVVPSDWTLVEQAPVDDGKTKTNGTTDFGAKAVTYVPGETFLHEVVHVALEPSISDHLRKGGKVNPLITKAQDLLDSFISRYESSKAAGKKLSDAHTDLYTQLKAAKASGDISREIHEFFAWGLSDKDISADLKSTRSKVVGIIRALLNSIRKITRGNDTAPKDTDYSVLLDISKELISQQVTKVSVVQEATPIQDNLFHQVSSNTAKVSEKIAPIFQSLRFAGSAKVEALTQQVKETAKFLGDAGFNLNPAESILFQQVVGLMNTLKDLNPLAMVKAQEVFSQASKQLSFRDFMVNPDSEDPKDIAKGTLKYEALFASKTGSRAFKTSQILPNFLAMSLVDESLRQALTKVKLDSIDKPNNESLDNKARRVANEMLESVADTLAGTADKQGLAAIDKLVYLLFETDKQKTIFDTASESITGGEYTINEYLKEAMAIVADKVAESNLPATVKVITGSVFSENKAKLYAEATMNLMMNYTEGRGAVFDLVNNFIGRRESTGETVDFARKIKTKVEQHRQQYNEVLPKVLAESFNETLTPAQWSSLHTSLGKTELGIMLNSMSKEELLETVGSQESINKAIKQYEGSFPDISKVQRETLILKSKQLANFMINGVAGINLHRNVGVIVSMFGTTVAPIDFDEKSMGDLDTLVSLYALDLISKGDKKTLFNLVKTEAKGLTYTLSYLQGLVSTDITKSKDSEGGMNGYKGYIPAVNRVGSSLVIALDTESKRLRDTGYVRVGDYVKSSADPETGSLGYYYSDSSSKPAFQQGAIQNIHGTFGGVNASSGLTTHNVSNYVFMGKKELAKIRRALTANQETGTNLLPVYDYGGKVKAYERGVDPAMLARLEKDTHLAIMMAKWRGRQIEEVESQVLNNQLVKLLADKFKAAPKSEHKQYINLNESTLSSTDPVLYKAYKLLSDTTKDAVREHFGSDALMVRKDLVNDILGYHTPSVTDLWSGNTRWSPKTVSAVKSVLKHFFGDNTYKYLYASEKFIQDVVHRAKETIIVKSAVVPAANMVSNILQLSTRGVPMNTIVSSMKSKTLELIKYIKLRDSIIQLEAEARANPGRAKAIAARIQAIEDTFTHLSIYPMIEAGEFSSISDGAVSRDDIHVIDGKFDQMVNKAIGVLPSNLQNIANQILVGKDTALYQLLKKSVDFGDFLAKSVYYDYLLTQKTDPKVAAGLASEEFVDTSRLSGRDQHYLESIGLVWFPTFKIRSTKIALSMIRNNPAGVLLKMVLPVPDALGSPVTDNFISKLLSGHLGYSLGWGQAIRAINLNPLVNVLT
jgi:hypothetical protein